MSLIAATLILHIFRATVFIRLRRELLFIFAIAADEKLLDTAAAISSRLAFGTDYFHEFRHAFIAFTPLPPDISMLSAIRRCRRQIA